MNENDLAFTYFKSPLGMIELSATENGISSLYFVSEATQKSVPNKILSDCVKQLEEYFENKRKEFSIPLDMQGTDFQQKVWNELLNIPFGKTISYLQLAKRLGDAKSIRAVGGANGKNPVSIIVPCHRVIGAGGALGGYGGNLQLKRELLRAEGIQVGANRIRSFAAVRWNGATRGTKIKSTTKYPKSSKKF